MTITPQPPRKPRILASARTVSLLTLASRILGLVRDAISATLFGTGAVWDAFVLAFTVPNLFRQILGEGALTSAVVPTLAGRLEQGRESEARGLYRAVAARLGAALVALTLLGWLGSVAYLAWRGVPAPSADKASVTVWLTIALLPYLPLVCLAALAAAALAAVHRFAVASASQVLMNCVWIAGAAFLIGTPWSLETKALALSAFVVAGGAIQLVWSYAAARRAGFPVGPSWSGPPEALREVGARFVPSLIALSVAQVNVLCDRLVAAFFVPGDGAISALYYGNRLLQFPISLVGFAAATAALPAFARAASRGDRDGLREAVSSTLAETLFLAIPATVGLLLLRDGIVTVLFQRGAFEAASADRTSAVLFFYALAAWPLCASAVLTRALYATGDHRTPMRIAIAAVAANFVLNLTLVHPFREAGLALATAISATFQAGVLWIVVHRGIGLTGALRSALRTTIAAAGMAAILAVVAHFVRVDRLAGLALAIAAGAAGYAAISLIVNRAETLRAWRESAGD